MWSKQHTGAQHTMLIMFVDKNEIFNAYLMKKMLKFDKGTIVYIGCL